MPSVEGSSIPLGTATALLEVDFSQLDRATKEMEALTRRVRGLQETLTEGNQQLAQSARQVSQAQGTRGGRQPQTAAQQAQAAAAATQAAVRAEQQRVQAAGQAASAETKVTQQIEQQNAALKEQFSLQQRIAQSARARASQEQATSFTGGLRQAAFGGGAPAAAGGAAGFGRGNPNIPTFAQFGLFPFAGLAGTLGAQGAQQGILGVSSALGIAELGSFRNAIVRLATQLQGLGGIFGSLATKGAEVAGKLGASSGGLVASLTSIGFAVAPLVALIGGIALLGKALDDLSKGVDVAVENINRRAEQIAQGTTSRELRGQIREQQVGLTARQDALTQLRAIFEEARGQGVNLAPEQAQRVQAITGQQLGFSAFGSFAELRQIVEALQTQADETAVSIAADTATLNSQEIATNDAAAATDRLTQANLDAAEAARGLTNAQIDKKIDELQTQFAGIAPIISTNVNISAEYRDQLVEQSQDIIANIQALEAQKSPFRDFIVSLQKLPEIFSSGVDLLKDIGGRFSDRFKDLRRENEDQARQEQREQEDSNRQRLNQLTDFGRQLQQEDADRERQRGQQIEDFERSLSEMREDQQDKVQELTDDYNEKNEDAEEEHQRKLAEIQREGRITILEAAARLDARGVVEAQRRIREQIRKENESYDDQKQEREEQFREALQELEDNLADQQAKRREDFNRQLARQDQEFALSRQRKIDDFNRNLVREDQERALRLQREDQERAIRRQRQQQDFNQQIADLVAHFANMNQISTTGFGFLRQGFQNFITDLASTATRVATNPYSQTPGSIFATRPSTTYQSQPGSIFSHASGTPFVPYTGLARVHYGEGILDAAENRQYQQNKASMGGSPNITVNFNGDMGGRSDAEITALGTQAGAAAYAEWMRQLLSQGIAMASGGRSQ